MNLTGIIGALVCPPTEQDRLARLTRDLAVTRRVRWKVWQMRVFAAVNVPADEGLV